MNDNAPQQRNDATMPDFDFGDYIANATSHESQQLDIFTGFQQQQQQQQQQRQTNMDNSHNVSQQYPQNQPQNIITAEMLNLKGRLEQQMKLQQLQQLILQQQIELLNGPSSISNHQKEDIFSGLLTPGPSAELPTVVPKGIVPPMMLQSNMFIDSPSATSIVNQLSPNQHPINPSFSAPAALAFPNASNFTLPNSSQPEYDISPLTSPWMQEDQQQHIPQPPYSRPNLKRAISSTGENEQGGMRKRASPPFAHSRRHGSTSSSAASTPAMHGMAPGSGHAHYFISSNDTPSPVDLSMPPPGATQSSASSSALGGSASNSTSVSPNIAPMTPASILNLRRLSTGLISSPLNMVADKQDSGPANTAASKKSVKGKGVAKPSPTTTVSRGRKTSLAKSTFSPNLKPLLPGGNPPTPVSPLAQPFNSPSALTLPTSTIQGPRKTSHKAAEQKRRDSLKTSFDELRLLLPPVPLLPEEGSDEPPLPGSMPPRGPPKGDADGPNRAVSKLALLRCGNSYIKELKEMVERRDKEIETLRDEVRKLRSRLGEGEVEGELDLERDVDEGKMMPIVNVEEGEGDEDNE